MKPIQIILLMSLAALVFMYFARFRSRLFDRVIVFLLGAVSIAMVMIPDWSHQLAHLVGVGRGADLITYLGLVGLAFIYLMHQAQLRTMEARLTELTRAFAIEHAHTPEVEQDGLEGEDSDRQSETPLDGEKRLSNGSR